MRYRGLASAAILLAGLAVPVIVATPASANTGSIVPNGSKVTATITGPSDSALFSFSASAGDVVNLTATAGTFAGACDALLQLDDAFGRVLVGPVCTGTSAFLGNITLPGAGGYVVKVTPNSNNTGSVKLQLSRNAADSSISLNGGAVTFTANHPGQGRNYSFAGSDGDVINLTAANGTYPGSCDVEMEIVDSHNRGIVGPACAGVTAFFGSVVLPGTGTYLVKVLSNDGNMGSVRYQLSRNAADSSIAVNGAAVTFTANHPGQGRNYRFAANAGDVINLTAANGTYPGSCDVEMEIVDSHNRGIVGPACAGVTAFFGSVVLPGTGTYLVKVLSNDGNMGSVQYQLSRNDADAPISVNGAVTFTAIHPGQGRNYSFTAIAGESLDLTTSSGTYPGACDLEIAIADSFGRTLAGPACGAISGSLDAVVIPGAGTYLVELLPTDGNTGSVHITLADGA